LQILHFQILYKTVYLN